MKTLDKQKYVYADFMLLFMIACMPVGLFRIKATERRDNMQDIEGILNLEKVNSARKTMYTTTQIYIPKSREL